MYEHKSTDVVMGIDPQKKSRRGPLPSLHFHLSPPIPLEVGPLNSVRGSGGAM